MMCLLALMLYHWCGSTTVCWLYVLGSNRLHCCVCAVCKHYRDAPFWLVAVLAGAVCLVVPLDGLAVLLVFVDQHTLAAAPRFVLGDGQLRYLPPPMSALLHHCCGR